MSEEFRKALGHDADCPPIETLIDVMEHGAGGDRASFENHLRSCPSCQTELAMYRGFEAGEIQADERDAVAFIVKRLDGKTRETVSFRQRFLTPAWMGGAAVAMAAILVVVGLTSQWRLRRGFEPSPDDRTLRTNALTITSPRGEVTQSPSIVEWEPVEGASEYTVTLSEIDRRVIFYKKVTSSRLLVPEEIRTLLVPGKTVVLEVKAADRPGRTIAQSGAIHIRIRER